MNALISRADLLTPAAYAAARPAMRARVIAEKQRRRVALGEHLMLIFENELLVRYQIQEMLRIEGIVDAEGIDHELASYLPLLPGNGNLTATLQIEYPDERERRRMLALLCGIECAIWLRVAGWPAVAAIADEDLARTTAEKTSAVHFLRFALTPPMIAAAKDGAALAVGVDHPHYRAVAAPLAEATRRSLLADLA